MFGAAEQVIVLIWISSPM